MTSAVEEVSAMKEQEKREEFKKILGKRILLRGLLVEEGDKHKRYVGKVSEDEFESKIDEIAPNTPYVRLRSYEEGREVGIWVGFDEIEIVDILE